MIYCDTSLLVAALTSEPHSAVARPWLLAQERRSLVISDWTMTEFGCAIAMKQRRGAIDATHRTVIEQGWARLHSDFTMMSVTRHHFHAAAGLVDAGAKGLRAGDALHLAIALAAGCDLATFDRDLADAAISRGVTVHPAPP